MPFRLTNSVNFDVLRSATRVCGVLMWRAHRSPVTWHITEPVDPTEYQNEWLGSVINIY